MHDRSARPFGQCEVFDSHAFSRRVGFFEDLIGSSLDVIDPQC